MPERCECGQRDSSQPSDQPLPDEPLPLSQSDAPPVAESVPTDTADASHPNRVQRAGSAVGGLARKSYRCVVSLFRNCSGDGDTPQ